MDALKGVMDNIMLAMPGNRCIDHEQYREYPSVCYPFEGKREARSEDSIKEQRRKRREVTVRP